MAWAYLTEPSGLASIFIILAGGVVTSYTDLRQGIIRNRDAALIAILGGGISIYNSYGTGLLLQWLFSAFFVIAFPLVLWWRGLIPAGDAKLMMAFGLALPSWWFPSFAPLIFGFSLVVFVAFLILAMPVVMSAFFGSRRHASEVVKDKIPESVFFEGAKKIMAPARFVPSILLPAWIFLLVWYAWTKFGVGRSYYSTGAWLGMFIVFAAFLVQEFCARTNINLFIAVILLIATGAGCSYLGAGWLVLVATAAGTLLLVTITSFVKARVAGSTIDGIPAEMIRKGNVPVGWPDAEGLSERTAEFLRSEGKSLLVWQEVRFAHALFIAVLIIGAISLAEHTGLVSPLISGSGVL